MLFMKHALAILPFLALAAGAQDDIYQTLGVGDRLQVTFRSGGSLIGTLVPPPTAGTAALMRKRTAVDVQAPATPFGVLLFWRKTDASAGAQQAVLEAWLKQHPEGQLTRFDADDKASPAMLKQYSVAATPSIVLQDAASGVSQTHLGLQSLERLEAGLGRLRSKVADAKVDYSKEAFLTLDVSLEYPGLNGTMSLARKDIRDVRKLQKLDEATRRRLEEEQKKIREGQAADETARREFEARRTADGKKELENAEKAAAEADAKADEAKALEDKAAKIKSGDDLLKQFPPDQWNDERKQVILNKSQAKLPISPEERAFLDKQAEWSEAVKSDKARKEKAEKEKAEKQEEK
jgi:hypothetical protein